MRTISLLAPLLATFIVPGVVSAQSTSGGNAWSHGTTATAIVGAATDSNRSGSAIGAGIGWEITPHVGVEGDGAWLAFGDGLNAFAGSFKARLRIFGKRPIDPVVHAGVGFYRASFSTSARGVPPFYQRRMNGRPGPGASRLTFSDPSLVFGGGINIYVNRHLALRPAVDAAIVIRDRRHYLVTTIALQAVFHFEDHPVTPSVPRVPPRSLE